jgi:predicted phosphodiesterase
MRWLHLTDVHVGRPDEAQKSALRSLVAAVRKHSNGKPYDAVVVTGDLSYSGLRAEYEQFDNLVIKPLRSDSLFTGASFIAVPGNHDLDCNAAHPLSWATLDPKRQSKWFGNDSDGKQVRGPRDGAFAAYSAFVQQAGLASLDPLERCSQTIRIAVDERKFAFVSLNTALFSYVNLSDERKAPAPLLALRSELQTIEPGTIPIVLGHHPFAWFTHQTQEPFRTALLEANAIYLHGHLHQVRVTHSAKGLESIGFGALYPNALEVQADAYYENSFAICEYRDGALHIGVYSWDGVHGLWRPGTRLPVDFCQRSDLLPEGHIFQWPRSTSGTGHFAKVRPQEHRTRLPSSIIATQIPSSSEWCKLLRLLGELSHGEEPAGHLESPGEVEFKLSRAEESQLVRCISGQGRILSLREIEAENTRLDTGEHEAVLIVTLGAAEQAARQLAIKLARRKPFRLLTNEDIAAAISSKLGGPVSKHIELLPPDVQIAYVLHEGSIGAIIEGGILDKWFYLVDQFGTCIDEASDLVQRLRSIQPQLNHAAYKGSGTGTPVPAPVGDQAAFRRIEYLRQCQLDFDDIKYAPLAALGIKFPKAKLLDIYIPATAEVAAAETASEQLTQAFDDFLDGMDLDDSSRAQLRSQLLERFSGGQREGGDARAFYQQHRNILVLGDPGSGKTCFVKHEILSYCIPSSETGSWYELHTPVFVSLVEAAPLLRDDVSLFEACSTVLARRGIKILTSSLQNLAENGHVAFFFDGLDEVPSLELRARIMREIADLLKTYSPIGNRIVLTSRPAALEGLDMPEALTTLHIRHLSTSEIGELARKILSLQLSEGGQKVTFGAPGTNASLVEVLLRDCETKPGIGRLARNPLLLSLLVMIYANSGAPAAKRHRIYAQAVQTLVSVRNRIAGQAVLSESDLRQRLGAVALAIYDDQVPELPTREDVVRIMSETLDQETSASDRQTAADAFLQRVAEGTGLLAIHSNGKAKETATVTFMHHSFLEYYAAVGLIVRRETERLPALADIRRWREVVSLAAGLVGDQADVAPLIARLLVDHAPSDEISQSYLLFAFDCALECDVPPEKAQQALCDALRKTMSLGPGRVDAGFRGDLAERIAHLWEATGSDHLVRCLVDGIRATDMKVAAAYVDLVGRVGVHTILPDEICTAFQEVAGVRDNTVRVALYGAASRCRELRSDAVIAALGEGFSGNFAVKFAAAHAAEETPALASALIEFLEGATDDVQAPIAAAASKALLGGDMDMASPDIRTRLLVEKCLRRWEQLAQPKSAPILKMRVSVESLDEMLSSPSKDERILAVRLLPWLERHELHVHDRIFEIIALERSPAEVVAALASLRLSPSAAMLASSADIDVVIALMRGPTRTRDVRIAAIRALSVFPAEDRVINALLEHCRISRHGEFRECLHALTVCSPDNEIVHAFVREAVRKAIAGPLSGTFGKPAEQYDFRRLLRVAGELGIEVNDSIASALVSLAEDFRAPTELRSDAIRAYLRLAPPTPRTVDQVVTWIAKHARPFEWTVAANVFDVLRRARQRVETARDIYSSLPNLEGALVSEWTRLRPERAKHIDDFAFRGMRSALRIIREMQGTYGEFTVRPIAPQALVPTES